MEVASPLPFGHVQPGSKRRFATCSNLDATSDTAMDDSATYGSSFKRRRCDNMEMSNVSSENANPQLLSSHQHHHHSPFPSLGNKRQRHEEAQDTTHKHLRNIIDRQNTEIQKLRSEKLNIENSYKELSASTDKNQKENTALKKVLAIKQVRQEQFVSELEHARRYKEQAEQLIAALRQHLHAQQSHGSTREVGFNNGGPHVY